jgi:hypothetical protein
MLQGALGVVGSVAVVATAAVVTYGVASLVDGSSSEDEARVQESVTSPFGTGNASPDASASAADKTTVVGGLLRADNRDHLALCVDAVNVDDDLAIEAGAIARVQEALAQVMENPDWVRVARSPELSTAAPEVSPGCPISPALFDPKAGPALSEFVRDNVGRCVDQASAFLFHVYILPPEEILRVVGTSENYHFGSEEDICYGDERRPVTTGLYFSPTEIEDPALIAREIEFVVGLR